MGTLGGEGGWVPWEVRVGGSVGTLGGEGGWVPWEVREGGYPDI